MAPMATTSRPAYTGPSPNNVPDTIPDTHAATVPSGEMRYSSRTASLPGTAMSGAFVALNASGTSAIAIRPAISMNRYGPDGSDSVRRNWPSPMPPYSTSI